MDFRQFRKIEKGEFFIVAADTSAGMGDYCAVQFLSKTKLDIPLVYHSKLLATEMTNALHPVLEKLSDLTGVKPIVTYERNAGGVFELERLSALNRLGKYRIHKMMTYGSIDNPDVSKLGWDTNSATRPKMLADWKEAVDKHLVAIYDKPTINEHFSFILSQTSSSIKAKAESNAHDDLVMSCAIAYQLYQTEEPHKLKADYKDFPDDTRQFNKGFY
jgi:hypothetical protein